MSERFKGRRATLVDIAERAGVSVTTASYALSGKGSINSETRSRIRNIAADMKYVPSRLAKALRGGPTQTIGVVINQIHNPFFNEVLVGFERVADKRGYTYVVSQTHDDVAKEERQLRLLAASGVDAIVLLPCSSVSAHVEAVRRDYAIPISLIGNSFANGGFSSVVADNAGGAQVVTNHLLSLGRPVVHLAGPSDQSMSVERRRAFESALLRASPGTSVQSRVFPIGEMSARDGYAAMHQVISAITPPVSVFAANDETAFGVIQFCNAHSLDIPGDVAVAGFGDIEILRTLSIPLTSARIPAARLGEQVASTVLDAIAGGADMRHESIVLPVRLVVRGSTDVRPSDAP